MLQDRGLVARREHDALPRDREHDVVRVLMTAIRVTTTDSNLTKAPGDGVILDQRIRDEAATAAVHRVEAVEPVVIGELHSWEQREDLRLFFALLLGQGRGLAVMYRRHNERDATGFGQRLQCVDGGQLVGLQVATRNPDTTSLSM
ncbi:MAG TPA: hypothetical protein VFO57_05275 [Burkholderiales bacterium]|nr:hypothetical protein [Burkholderiales bacterium]